MQLTIDIRLTPTHDGGRRGLITAGYRSCWDNGDTLDGEKVIHDAPMLLLEPGTVYPGESASAVVQPIFPDAKGWEHVRVGDVMTMVEGSRVCGTAVVAAMDPDAFDPLWPTVAPSDLPGH